MKYRAFLLTGAAATALFIGGAAPTLAAADPIPKADTYASLLDPVPDAAVRLAADDAFRVQGARLEQVQYYEHHHHHHHSAQQYGYYGYNGNGGGWAHTRPYYPSQYSSGWYQSNGYYWNGWAWARRPQYHHHHHHHHQSWW